MESRQATIKSKCISATILSSNALSDVTFWRWAEMSKKLIGSMVVMMWVGLQLVWVSTEEVAQVPEECRETYQAIEKILDE